MDTNTNLTLLQTIIKVLGDNGNSAMHYQHEISHNIKERYPDLSSNIVPKVLGKSNIDDNFFDKLISNYLKNRTDIFETGEDKNGGLYKLTQEGVNRYNELKSTSRIIVEPYKTLLEKNHNIILHGAPGTGKTYLAHQIAEAMGASFEMVQFHPSYDYTDFVEGLRPKNSNKGEIVFERMDGIFKAFCKKAIISPVIETTVQYITENKAIKQAWDLTIEDINNSGEGLVLDKKRGNKTNPIKYNEEQKAIEITYISGTQPRPEYIYFDRIELIFKDYWYNTDNIAEIPCNELASPRKENKDNASNINETQIDKNSPSKDLGIYCYFSTDQVWPLLQYIKNKYIECANSTDKNRELPLQSEESFITQEQSIPKFVFLIDEINRGDLSKIFGELFFSIDPGYRVRRGEEDKAKRVPTQYQNLVAKTYTIKKEDGTEEVLDDPFYEGFYIPDNVYIIGTMNDIDRSVESMDFAMRRRFQFIEVKAEDRADQMFTNEETGTKYPNADQAKKILQELNKCISEKVENKGIGLTSAYHIGPSYFMKYAKGEETTQELWNYRLEGLLREYLRGEDDADGKLNLLKESVLDNKDTSASNSENNTTEQK